MCFLSWRNFNLLSFGEEAEEEEEEVSRVSQVLNQITLIFLFNLKLPFFMFVKSIKVQSCSWVLSFEQ